MKHTHNIFIYIKKQKCLFVTSKARGCVETRFARVLTDLAVSVYSIVEVSKLAEALRCYLVSIGSVHALRAVIEISKASGTFVGASPAIRVLSIVVESVSTAAFRRIIVSVVSLAREAVGGVVVALVALVRTLRAVGRSNIKVAILTSAKWWIVLSESALNTYFGY